MRTAAYTSTMLMLRVALCTLDSPRKCSPLKRTSEQSWSMKLMPLLLATCTRPSSIYSKVSRLLRMSPESRIAALTC